MNLRAAMTVALGLSLALGASACGHQALTVGGAPLRSGGTAPVVRPTDSPEVTSTVLAQARTYDSGNVHLDPPLATTPVAQTSATQALALCKTVAPCGPGSPTSVEFGLFTDDVYGNPKATPYPEFENVPSWLLTWHDVPCLVLGPKPVANPPSTC